MIQFISIRMRNKRYGFTITKIKAFVFILFCVVGDGTRGLAHDGPVYHL
jgi:hypothetical protein